LRQNVINSVISNIFSKLYAVSLPFTFLIVKQQLISNHQPGSNIWLESGCAERCRTFIMDVTVNTPKFKFMFNSQFQLALGDSQGFGFTLREYDMVG
jgi:hypothetical protein